MRCEFNRRCWLCLKCSSTAAGLTLPAVLFNSFVETNFSDIVSKVQIPHLVTLDYISVESKVANHVDKCGSGVKLENELVRPRNKLN